MTSPASRESRRTGAPVTSGEQVHDSETPRGTLFILLLYAGAIVVLWGYAYAKLLLRG